eukprot:15470357-Alexandrium_andersonii.AAC.1
MLPPSAYAKLCGFEALCGCAYVLVCGLVFVCLHMSLLNLLCANVHTSCVCERARMCASAPDSLPPCSRHSCQWPLFSCKGTSLASDPLTLAPFLCNDST